MVSKTDNLLFPRGLTPARDNASKCRLDRVAVAALNAPEANAGTEPRRGAIQLGTAPIRGTLGHLARRPGMGGARYRLTLRLRPEAPGGLTGRAFEVRELQPDGIVWLTGRTNTAGVIQAVWAHLGLNPRDRPFAGGLRIVDIEP